MRFLYAWKATYGNTSSAAHGNCKYIPGSHKLHKVCHVVPGMSSEEGALEMAPSSALALPTPL